MIDREQPQLTSSRSTPTIAPMATNKHLMRRGFQWLAGALVPAGAFLVVVSIGLSFATMLPYTARAHGGCTQCVHDINHWTCGASNSDNTLCNKVNAALCMDLKADCVGSTTAISGGGLSEGNDRFTLSSTSL
jgi:hypothetical protein